MLGKGVDIMELSMNTADAGDAGFSLVTLPEHVRCAYRIGRQAGRLMAELAVLVRAMAVRGAAGDEAFDYAGYLAGLGCENRYASLESFVRGYFFDRRNPDALRAAALGLAQGVLTMKDALGTGAQKPVIWQHLQRLLVLADGAVLPLDLAALYRLQVQGQLLAKNGRLIAPRAELRAAVEQVFRV